MSEVIAPSRGRRRSSAVVFAAAIQALHDVASEESDGSADEATAASPAVANSRPEENDGAPPTADPPLTTHRLSSARTLSTRPRTARASALRGAFSPTASAMPSALRSARAASAGVARSSVSSVGGAFETWEASAAGGTATTGSAAPSEAGGTSTVVDASGMPVCGDSVHVAADPVPTTTRRPVSSRLSALEILKKAQEALVATPEPTRDSSEGEVETQGSAADATLTAASEVTAGSQEATTGDSSGAAAPATSRRVSVRDTIRVQILSPTATAGPTRGAGFGAPSARPSTVQPAGQMTSRPRTARSSAAALLRADMLFSPAHAAQDLDVLAAPHSPMKGARTYRLRSASEAQSAATPGAPGPSATPSGSGGSYSSAAAPSDISAELHSRASHARQPSAFSAGPPSTAASPAAAKGAAAMPQERVAPKSFGRSSSPLALDGGGQAASVDAHGTQAAARAPATPLSQTAPVLEVDAGASASSSGIVVAASQALPTPSWAARTRAGSHVSTPSGGMSDGGLRSPTRPTISRLPLHRVSPSVLAGTDSILAGASHPGGPQVAAAAATPEPQAVASQRAVAPGSAPSDVDMGAASQPHKASAGAASQLHSADDVALSKVGATRKNSDAAAVWETAGDRTARATTSASNTTVRGIDDLDSARPSEEGNEVAELPSLLAATADRLAASAHPQDPKSERVISGSTDSETAAPDAPGAAPRPVRRVPSASNMPPLSVRSSHGGSGPGGGRITLPPTPTSGSTGPGAALGIALRSPGIATGRSAGGTPLAATGTPAAALSLHIRNGSAASHTTVDSGPASSGSSSGTVVINSGGGLSAFSHRSFFPQVAGSPESSDEGAALQRSAASTQSLQRQGSENVAAHLAPSSESTPAPDSLAPSAAASVGLLRVAPPVDTAAPSPSTSRPALPGDLGSPFVLPLSGETTTFSARRGSIMSVSRVERSAEAAAQLQKLRRASVTVNPDSLTNATRRVSAIDMNAVAAAMRGMNTARAGGSASVRASSTERSVHTPSLPGRDSPKLDATTMPDVAAANALGTDGSASRLPELLAKLQAHERAQSSPLRGSDSVASVGMHALAAAHAQNASVSSFGNANASSPNLLARRASRAGSGMSAQLTLAELSEEQTVDPSRAGPDATRTDATALTVGAQAWMAAGAVGPSVHTPSSIYGSARQPEDDPTLTAGHARNAAPGAAPSDVAPLAPHSEVTVAATSPNLPRRNSRSSVDSTLLAGMVGISDSPDGLLTARTTDDAMEEATGLDTARTSSEEAHDSQHPQPENLTAPGAGHDHRRVSQGTVDFSVSEATGGTLFSPPAAVSDPTGAFGAAVGTGNARAQSEQADAVAAAASFAHIQLREWRREGGEDDGPHARLQFSETALMEHQRTEHAAPDHGISAAALSVSTPRRAASLRYSGYRPVLADGQSDSDALAATALSPSLRTADGLISPSWLSQTYSRVRSEQQHVALGHRPGTHIKSYLDQLKHGRTMHERQRAADQHTAAPRMQGPPTPPPTASVHAQEQSLPSSVHPSSPVSQPDAAARDVDAVVTPPSPVEAPRSPARRKSLVGLPAAAPDRPPFRGGSRARRGSLDSSLPHRPSSARLLMAGSSAPAPAAVPLVVPPSPLHKRLTRHSLSGADSDAALAASAAGAAVADEASQTQVPAQAPEPPVARPPPPPPQPKAAFRGRTARRWSIDGSSLPSPPPRARGSVGETAAPGAEPRLAPAAAVSQTTAGPRAPQTPSEKSAPQPADSQLPRHRRGSGPAPAVGSGPAPAAGSGELSSADVAGLISLLQSVELHAGLRAALDAAEAEGQQAGVTQRVRAPSERSPSGGSGRRRRSVTRGPEDDEAVEILHAASRRAQPIPQPPQPGPPATGEPPRGRARPQTAGTIRSAATSRPEGSIGVATLGMASTGTRPTSALVRADPQAAALAAIAGVLPARKPMSYSSELRSEAHRRRMLELEARYLGAPSSEDGGSRAGASVLLAGFSGLEADSTSEQGGRLWIDAASMLPGSGRHGEPLPWPRPPSAQPTQRPRPAPGRPASAHPRATSAARDGSSPRHAVDARRNSVGGAGSRAMHAVDLSALPSAVQPLAQGVHDIVHGALRTALLAASSLPSSSAAADEPSARGTGDACATLVPEHPQLSSGAVLADMLSAALPFHASIASLLASAAASGGSVPSAEPAGGHDGPSNSSSSSTHTALSALVQHTVHELAWLYNDTAQVNLAAIQRNGVCAATATRAKKSHRSRCAACKRNAAEADRRSRAAFAAVQLAAGMLCIPAGFVPVWLHVDTALAILQQLHMSDAAMGAGALSALYHDPLAAVISQSYSRDAAAPVSVESWASAAGGALAPASAIPGLLCAVLNNAAYLYARGHASPTSPDPYLMDSLPVGEHDARGPAFGAAAACLQAALAVQEQAEAAGVVPKALHAATLPPAAADRDTDLPVAGRRSSSAAQRSHRFSRVQHADAAVIGAFPEAELQAYQPHATKAAPQGIFHDGSTDGLHPPPAHALRSVPDIGGTGNGSHRSLVQADGTAARVFAGGDAWSAAKTPGLLHDFDATSSGVVDSSSRVPHTSGRSRPAPPTAPMNPRLVSAAGAPRRGRSLRPTSALAASASGAAHHADFDSSTYSGFTTLAGSSALAPHHLTSPPPQHSTDPSSTPGPGGRRPPSSRPMRVAPRALSPTLSEGVRHTLANVGSLLQATEARLLHAQAIQRGSRS